MAEIVTLLPRVAQVVRRCPEPMLVQAYRDAARKFCVESRWLRRELAFDSVAGTDEYDIGVGTGDEDNLLEIIGIRAMTGATSVAPVQQWRLSPTDPTTWNPQVASTDGRPYTYTYMPESSVVFFPVPDAAYAFTVTLQVQPRTDVEELPDDLLRKWDRSLADGALAYLLGVPGQAWSNPNAAVLYARNFQAAINNAKADEQRSYNTGTSMARIRNLFGSYSI